VALDWSSPTDFEHATAKEKILVRKAHQTLKRVTNDFEGRWHFNTSIALIMELVNELTAQEPLDQNVTPTVLKNVLSVLVLMLSPMTPHIAEEMWEVLGNAGSISVGKSGHPSRESCGQAAWPSYREDLTREEQVEVVVQINGRLRGKLLVDASLGEEDTKQRGIQDPRIAPLIQGKEIAKVIVVPKKLVNIVLK